MSGTGRLQRLLKTTLSAVETVAVAAAEVQGLQTEEPQQRSSTGTGPSPATPTSLPASPTRLPADVQSTWHPSTPSWRPVAPDGGAAPSSSASATRLGGWTPPSASAHAAHGAGSQAFSLGNHAEARHALQAEIDHLEDMLADSPLRTAKLDLPVHQRIQGLRDQMRQLLPPAEHRAKLEQEIAAVTENLQGNSIFGDLPIAAQAQEAKRLRELQDELRPLLPKEDQRQQLLTEIDSVRRRIELNHASEHPSLKVQVEDSQRLATLEDELRRLLPPDEQRQALQAELERRIRYVKGPHYSGPLEPHEEAAQLRRIAELERELRSL